MGIMLLWNEVLEHEKAFNEYLHYVGAGDAERASDAARTLLKGISSTLEKVQKEYPALVIDAQLPDYWEMRKRFETSTPDAAELRRLGSKLQAYVAAMEKEVLRHRRKEPPKWLVEVINRRKIILIAFGSIVAGWLIVLGLVTHLHRGQGLAGEYYGDMELGIFYRTRIDRQVDFRWNRESPFRGWRKDRFSVRWNGFIEIPKTGIYDIYVHVDDGARFYIDNKMVIDDWNPGKIRVIQVSEQLEAGYHPIRLDYFERTKWATVRLFWKPAGSPRPEPVPARYLCPSGDYMKPGIPVHAQIHPEPDEDEEEMGGAAPGGEPPGEQEVE